MVKVKYAVARKRRKKRTLKLVKGQRGARSKLYRQAVESLRRSLVYAYRDRRRKKRDFRSLWTIRINAACKMRGSTFNKFIHGLKIAKVNLNRKILAELALSDPVAFDKLVEMAKKK